MSITSKQFNFFYCKNQPLTSIPMVYFLLLLWLAHDCNEINKIENFRDNQSHRFHIFKFASCTWIFMVVVQGLVLSVLVGANPVCGWVVIVMFIFRYRTFGLRCREIGVAQILNFSLTLEIEISVDMPSLVSQYIFRYSRSFLIDHSSFQIHWVSLPVSSHYFLHLQCCIKSFLIAEFSNNNEFISMRLIVFNIC